MKKFSKLIFLTMMLCFAFSCFSSQTILFVKAETIFYARAASSNVKLYRTTSGSEEVSNVFFVIPQSYFVQIDECENEQFFVARYFDVQGYVKKADVQCVDGTPTTPFATASFRVFIPGGVELRSSPSQSEGLNTVSELNYLETNLKYYGCVDGEEAISHKSTTWFYAKLIKGGKETFGYVYSAYCDLLTTIPTNTESLEEIDEPDFSVNASAQPTQVETDGLTSLPSTTQIIIIVAVCLPCLVIIYLLFKPTKITARAIEDADLKTTRKRKKQRHQDYYEYDE